MATPMSVGANVKVLREQRGLTQKGLARLANMTQPQVSRLEQGGIQHSRLPLVKRLAEALGVSVASVLGERGKSTATAASTDPTMREIARRWDKLNPSAKAQVRDYVQFLMAQEVRKHKHKEQSR